MLYQIRMMDPVEFFLYFLFIPLPVYYIYWKCFIRITSVSHFQSGLQLRGKVLTVYDGDGFEFFHTPWYFHVPWFFHVLSFLYIPSQSDGRSTLSIRLAGIDAPETRKRHFGEPAQPFSVKAKKTLDELVLGKIVKLKLLKVDQYERILATCYLEGLFTTTNVNKKMVELGMACVYKGGNAVYDDYKDELLRLEAEAKQCKIGMWSQKDCVTPMQFKRELRNRNE